MRLLVTGATGLLGLNFCLAASEDGHQVTGLANSRGLQDIPFELLKIDLINTGQALNAIEAIHPDGIIHCAAIANMNTAREHPEMTMKVNGEVPGILAEKAYRLGIRFLHISTDAVFDGEKGNYVETDPTNPLSIYARTKLAGEQAVSDANPDAIIARVVFFGWSLSGSRSLSEFFFNHLKAGEPIKGFIDTFFSPLYVEDLSKILLELVSNDLTGVFHVVSPDKLSKYDFGRRIAKRFGFDPELVEPICGGEVDRGASRSLNLHLNPDKAQAALGYAFPTVDEGIDRMHQRWQEGYPDNLHNLAVNKLPLK